MHSLFTGNKRQHILVCSKIISSLLIKVSSIAKTYMSQGAVQGAVTLCGFCSWYLMGVCCVADWFQLQLYISILCILLLVGKWILCNKQSCVLISKPYSWSLPNADIYKSREYVGLSGIRLLVVRKYLSSCMWIFGTTQLELLLYRARPDHLTSAFQCLPEWLHWIRGRGNQRWAHLVLRCVKSSVLQIYQGAWPCPLEH